MGNNDVQELDICRYSDLVLFETECTRYPSITEQWKGYGFLSNGMGDISVTEILEDW